MTHQRKAYILQEFMLFRASEVSFLPAGRPFRQPVYQPGSFWALAAPCPQSNGEETPAGSFTRGIIFRMLRLFFAAQKRTPPLPGDSLLLRGLPAVGHGEVNCRGCSSLEG